MKLLDYWRNIPDVLGYQASYCGFIKSPKGKIIKGTPNKKGYLTIMTTIIKIDEFNTFID